MSHANCKCRTCKNAASRIRRTFPTVEAKRAEIVRIAIKNDLGFRALATLCQVWIHGFSDLRAAYSPQSLYVDVSRVVMN